MRCKFKMLKQHITPWTLGYCGKTLIDDGFDDIEGMESDAIEAVLEKGRVEALTDPPVA